MNVIQTQIQPRSAEFQASAAAMRALVDDLRARASEVSLGGGQSDAPGVTSILGAAKISGKTASVLICFNAIWHFVRLMPICIRLGRPEWREELSLSLLKPRTYLISQLKPAFIGLSLATAGLGLVAML